MSASNSIATKDSFAIWLVFFCSIGTECAAVIEGTEVIEVIP